MSEPQEIKFTGPTMWSSYTLDKFIAPNSSRLTVCGAEEISPPNNSLGSFLLNSIFILNFPDRDKAYFINFIRRSEQAQREYINARDILTELVEKKNERPSLYFQTLYHFEQSIVLLYQALMLMHKHLKMIDPSVEDFFKKGDGSREERLNEMYND